MKNQRKVANSDVGNTRNDATFLLFISLAIFIPVYLFCDGKKEVKSNVETRTRTLSVRLTPTDIEELQELQKELMDETNLRVTRGDLISYLIKFYRQRIEEK